MLGLDGDGDAVGLEAVHHDVGDLGGEALLELGAASDGVDEASEFGDADDAPAGDVGDVGCAAEGEKVVLADGEEGNIAEDDHFVVALVEADLEEGGGVDAASAEDFLEGGGDTAGGFAEAFAVGVFAEGEEEFADGGFGAGEVDSAVGGIDGLVCVVGHGRPATSAEATWA